MLFFDLCHNLLDASALHPGCGLRSHIGGYLPLLLVLGVSAEFFLLVILPGVPGVSSFWYVFLSPSFSFPFLFLSFPFPFPSFPVLLFSFSPLY